MVDSYNNIKSSVCQFFYILYCVNLKDFMAEAASIQIKRIDGLCYGSNVQMQSFHSGIKANVENLFIANNTVVVKKDINDNIKLNATIDRCSSIENLDSCELYHIYQNVDCCKLFNPKGGHPEMLKFKFSPPLRCPNSKGTYIATNTTIDVTSFTTFLTEGWYWKINIDIRTTRTLRLVYCLKINLHVTSK